MNLREAWKNVDEYVRAGLQAVGIEAGGPFDVKAESIESDDEGPLPGFEHWTGFGLYASNELIDDADGQGGGFFDGFLMTKSTTVPGCHTLPNGDPGYPDDVDVDEVETWKVNDWRKAARGYVVAIAEALIDDAFERANELAYAKEFEQEGSPS